jgi:SM-20-related protein
LAIELLDLGIAVRDQFLPAAEVRALIACALQRRERGEFAAARIGSDARQQRRGDIRGDLTCWLGEPMLPAERVLADALERLRLDLNREAFLGLFDLELHYAVYPPGAAYARHLDRLQGREQRKVSLVLYLNEGWQRAGGGQLRMFGPGDQSRDIEPIAGRLCVFLTAGREHAVLPTRCDRLSISGWFRGRD